MKIINNIEFKEKRNIIKEFTREHKYISYILIFVIIFMIIFNVLNAIVIPSKADVADMCEKHLRISTDFTNLTRFDNASSKVLENGDTLVTVKTNFYKIIARYDSNNILIGHLEEVFTIPFWPYIVYVVSFVISYIFCCIIISILKKNGYFRKLN